MIAAITKTINVIKGSYALAIICDDEKDTLYAIRCESPLLLGVGKKEYFVTSDIGAILNYTNKYILLGENEIVKLTKDNYTITKDGKEIHRDMLVSNTKKEDTDLMGYEHYMMKEIMEEPVLIHKLKKI